ncbi:MAG: triose-phosphate isomerase [Candidatus Eisenbacteria bacterium]|nr:triose-phosphate isomerase [Candidatus Eisenbacteria bacterium]
MRTTLIAGNWKMHLLSEEARQLVRGILAGLARVPSERELLLIPPYVWLMPVAAQLRETSRVKLGGQDVHWEGEGAFTSAISASMLRDAGCEYVLVGHSERRHVFGDDARTLARKLRAALAGGLQAIYCVGEQLAQREAQETEAVLDRQLQEVLGGLGTEEMQRLTLAYEPVWAIGTGRTATPEIAQQAHAHLRRRLAEEFGEAVASQVRILYGGSVKPDNAAELLAQTDIDGALVGGASLAAESFLGIAMAGSGVS